MPAESRFTFVQELGSGEERLVLAELVSERSARIVKEMARVPGSAPETDPSLGTPEPYSMLVVSPSNRLIAALSVQLGIDIIDFNINVFDMETGASTLFVNEHRFSETNKSTCRSEIFEQFVAAEEALGVDTDTIQGYDYSVNVETGSIEIAFIELTGNGKLLVGFIFEVHVDSFLGVETFEFELEPAGANAGEILSCNGGRRPTTPAPPSPLSLRPIATFPFLPVSSSLLYIHLEGYPLRFVPVRARSSPRNLLDLIRFGVISFASQVLQRFLHLLPWNRTRMLCTAKLVAGYPVWRRA